jgi:hypothetical protein
MTTDQEEISIQRFSWLDHTTAIYGWQSSDFRTDFLLLLSARHQRGRPASFNQAIESEMQVWNSMGRVGFLAEQNQAAVGSEL